MERGGGCNERTRLTTTALDGARADGRRKEECLCLLSSSVSSRARA